jgi:DNA polymerase III alpha subunit
MILYANQLGNKALALTDHESVSGHIKFIKTIEDLKKQEKIFFGLEQGEQVQKNPENP